jgi:hypothetical protein
MPYPRYSSGGLSSGGGSGGGGGGGGGDGGYGRRHNNDGYGGQVNEKLVRFFKDEVPCPARLEASVIPLTLECAFLQLYSPLVSFVF